MNIFSWIVSLFKKKNIYTDTLRIVEQDYTIPKAFVKTWSVVEFAKKYGKMQICKTPDYNNRESYLKCRFYFSENNITPVIISLKMQGITKEEISENKDKIRIGLLPNGKYVLYDFRWKDWEDVELN